jgi:hypothetical protein
LRRILQFRIGDRQIGIFVVLPIGDVFQKPVDHRSRYHVGDALSDVATVTLKRDANDFAVLHYRTAAIARINLSADLDCQMLVN